MRIRLEWCAATFLLLAWPHQASAQRTATSFEQLSVLVEAGDRITVVDSAGVETTGRLRRLSERGLTLEWQNQQRAWSNTEVSRILQRRQDSLANGALIGLAAGGGTVGLLAVLCAVEDCDTDGSVLVGAVAAYAGLGAGIGVGIDALITHSHVVYQRPTPSSALRFVPILSDGRRGLAVSLSY